MAADTKPTTIGTVPSGAGASTGRASQLAGQLAKLLADTIADASELEVRTYVIREGELGKDGQPTDANTQLRALTQIGMDGDTSVCLPQLANGELDEVVWRVHTETVAQARADRAATLAMAIELLAKLSPR